MVCYLYLVLGQLLTAAFVSVEAFQAAGTLPSSPRMPMTSLKLSSSGGDCDAQRGCNNFLYQSLLSTVAAASIFASSPVVAHANDDFVSYHPDNEMSADPKSSIAIASATQQHPLAASYLSSSMHISSSTLSSPMGEMADGSKVSAANSFGQWFTLLYIGISLLAGGNEVMKRIQKQMDKEDS